MSKSNKSVTIFDKDPWWKKYQKLIAITASCCAITAFVVVTATLLVNKNQSEDLAEQTPPPTTEEIIANNQNEIIEVIQSDGGYDAVIKTYDEQITKAKNSNDRVVALGALYQKSKYLSDQSQLETALDILISTAEQYKDLTDECYLMDVIFFAQFKIREASDEKIKEKYDRIMSQDYYNIANNLFDKCVSAANEDEGGDNE